MDLKILRNRVESVDGLATVPAVARRLLELLADQSVSLNEISRFISSDPALTTRVLMMVNSPVYGFPGRISSVSQAVLLLGLNVVRGLLFGVTVLDLMQRTMFGLWEHSVGSAIVARLMAKRKGLKDPEETSIYGLLHDIGKVVLLLQFPVEYEQVMKDAKERESTLYEAENAFFSTSHATVGAWIAAKWSFPAPLVDVIKYHHRPGLARVAPSEAAIVHLSDVLLRGRGFGFAGDYVVPPVDSPTWERVGLSESDISEILKEAEDLLEEAADIAL